MKQHLRQKMAELETLLMYPLSTDLATQEELQAAMSSKADYTEFKELSNDFYTVISGASPAFDTLKEIADWISSDQTSSSKLISDVVELQKDVRYISNDLSIDVSRVTVTEDDGYEKGALLGTITSNIEHSLEYGPTYGKYVSNDSFCFPIYILSDYGWDLSDVAMEVGINIYEIVDWLSGFDYVYGYRQRINAIGPLSTIYGDYPSQDGFVQVNAYFDSNYNVDGEVLWCTTQNDPTTVVDGASKFVFSEKLVNDNGRTVFRKPIVFWNKNSSGDDGYSIDASFVTFLDYEAIPKKKVQRYDSVVSATYATKSELANALTDYVDLTSDQTIDGKKTFGNISAYNITTWGEVRSKYSDDSFVKIDSNSGLTIVREGTETTIQNGLNYREFYLRDFRDGAPVTSNNYVENTWAFPAVVPELSSKTLVFADRDYVLGVVSGYTPVLSDYVKKEDIRNQLSSSLSGFDVADASQSLLEKLTVITTALSNLMTNL